MEKDNHAKNWEVIMVPREQVQRMVERATKNAEQRIAELGFDIDHSAPPLQFDAPNQK